MSKYVFSTQYIAVCWDDAYEVIFASFILCKYWALFASLSYRIKHKATKT